MISSYEQNDYAEVFHSIVLGFKPRVCVELGVLHGYSTLAIALSLKEIGEGQLDAYDLFNEYIYNHGDMEEVKTRLKKVGVEDIVTLHKADAFKIASTYPDDSIDLMHVDLSNTGEILRKIMQDWDSKLKVGSLLLFEGGTEERDRVEWMLKYSKEPIRTELEENLIIRARYGKLTFQKFPGLTLLYKER